MIPRKTEPTVNKLTILSMDGEELYSTEKMSEAMDKLKEYGVSLDNIPLNRGPHWIDDNRAILQKDVEEHGFTHLDIAYKASAFYTNEHIHEDNEMRLFCVGTGTFYINIDTCVLKIVCCEGDCLLVPPGTKHWFRTEGFVAIRFFTNQSGWSGQFTDSNISKYIR